MRHFVCRKFNLFAIDGGCSKYTCRAHVFLMRTLSACLSQFVVTVVLQVTVISSRIDFTLVAQRSRLERIIISCQNSSCLIAQCHTLHLAWALHLHLAHALLPWHDLAHFPRIRLSVSFNPAPIYVNLSVLHWRNPHPPQVMSPRIISTSPKTGISLNISILPNTRILRVKPLFFHQPSTASTCDSGESIATPPPDSDLHDDQIRALLASPLCLQEREANAGRSQVYHSER